jgi:tetratricopeptide (TPR) repeat protein
VLEPTTDLVFAVCFFSLTMGCSLPRVIVLEDPLTPQEHLNLGVSYESKGEYDLAIKEYKQAQGLPQAYLYLGNVYFAKNQWGLAESYYEKAITEMPKDADGYNNLAWLYYTKGENLEKAESLALKALELNPAKKEIYQDTLQKIRAARDQSLITGESARNSA